MNANALLIQKIDPTIIMKNIYLKKKNKKTEGKKKKRKSV
jgi:hypothetical protein